MFMYLISTSVALYYRPDYRETALYGRKWINRLVLQLAAIKEIAEAPTDADPKSNRFTQGQKMVLELTEGMLMSFVQKEETASQYQHSNLDEVIHKRYTALVHELLSGYGNMESEYLQKMSWISPVLLSSCIRSKNEDIRLMVQKLVRKTSAESTSSVPYPPPTAPKPAEEKEAISSEPTEPAAPTPAAPSDKSKVEEVEVESAKADAALPNGTVEKTAGF